MRRNPHFDRFESDWGIYFPGAVDYLPEDFKYGDEAAMASKEWRMAMDAQPTLISTPNAGIPVFLTTFIDPDILRILVAKNKAAEILGEVRKGDWIDRVAMFPVIEHTGEVTSYGDFNNNGRAKANAEWETRESYLYQTVAEYGELELERAGRARIGWASELKQSSINILNKYQNLTYFYGVTGLANYGLLNSPGLPAPISPAIKAAGGVSWYVGSTPNAQANEVYNDILAMFTQLVIQASGNITQEDELILALSPKSSPALDFTNIYNVNVRDILKKAFPKLRVETAIQYGVQSTINPQGSALGEIVQLICPKVEGQDTGFVAFTEKLRAHPIIRDMSSFKQKMTQGTWGAVVRQPFAFAQMIGV